MQLTQSSEQVAVVDAPLRARLAWAVYDLGATIWSMNVATLFFAVWLVEDLGASSRLMAVGNIGTSLLVILVMPVVGAYADARGRYIPWVRLFTLLAVGATVALGAYGVRATATEHSRLIVIGLFILANSSFQASMGPYNAMLGTLAGPNGRGKLSGLGHSLAYTGSIIGVLLATPFMNGSIPLLGPVSAGAMRWWHSILPFTEPMGRAATFVPTAILFGLVAIPLCLFGRDRGVRAPGVGDQKEGAFRGALAAIRDIPKHPGLGRFILASLLYQDAMGTIVSYMALYAVAAIGFKQGTETTVFVILTIPAVFGSVLIGRLTDKSGPRRTLLWVLLAWILLLIGMILAPSKAIFLAVGAGIGIIFGGLGTAERPMLLSLVGPEEGGRYFGLMVLSSRAAAVMGPLLWALAVDGLTPMLGKKVAYQIAVGTVAMSMLVAYFLVKGLPSRAVQSKGEI